MDIITYYMRAFDSGTGGWVYWYTTDPTATPSAAITQPTYTGILRSQMVVFTARSSVDRGSGGYKIFRFTSASAVTGSIVQRPVPHKVVRFRTFQAAHAISNVLVFSGSAVRVT